MQYKNQISHCQNYTEIKIIWEYFSKIVQKILS